MEAKKAKDAKDAYTSCFFSFFSVRCIFIIRSILMKILVVDDDLDNRTIAKETLESSGYQVCQATNGLEAIEAAEKEKPDLIFLDLSMPKMNGWDGVRHLKSMPQICDIPVIAFTAHAMVGDEKKAREAGCNDYLSKPCTPKMILEKVKEWLKKGI